ncbi:MAG: lysophospholipid acyltransferase family protein [Candidatus Omnitrophica bacterium]|nr:lysophospholipid acyltransferase family protein [Candidatus Omnitrophota bacterium]
MANKDKTYLRAFTRRISMGGLLCVEWLLGHLPRWCIAALISPLYYVVYPFMGRMRAITLTNLRAVYGPAKDELFYRKMTRDCLRRAAGLMIDMIYYVEHPAELTPRVVTHGEDRLREALDRGRGVIAVTAHLNNFPLMFVSLIQKGYKINVIIRPMRDPEFSKFMFGQCEKWGVHMIPTKPAREFLRETYGALQRKEMLFIVIDEIPPDNAGVPVNFFGKEVRRATGPLLFHRKFGSPVLPMFITQDEQNRFHVHIEEEIEILAGPAADTDAPNMNAMNAVIEKYIRFYPEQWGGWFNKRWSENQRLADSS